MINFFKGMIIGISMAAPVGPLAILCIRRSLKGHLEGAATAIGIAFADGLYAFIAALGVTQVHYFLVGKQNYLFMLGGIFLGMLGIHALKTPPSITIKPLKQRGFFITLLHTALLTLTNPMTIVTFIAAFAAVGFEGTHQPLDQALLISSGVFCGSVLWFLLLSIGISALKHRLTQTMVIRINTLSGSLLIIFGGAFFVHGLLSLLS